MKCYAGGDPCYGMLYMGGPLLCSATKQNLILLMEEGTRNCGVFVHEEGKKNRTGFVHATNYTGFVHEEGTRNCAVFCT